MDKKIDEFQEIFNFCKSMSIADQLNLCHTFFNEYVKSSIPEKHQSHADEVFDFVCRDEKFIEQWFTSRIRRVGLTPDTSLLTFVPADDFDAFLGTKIKSALSIITLHDR